MKRFAVLLKTIRRDLLLLEQQQLLQRVHGGAVKVGGMMHFHDFPYRMEEIDDMNPSYTYITDSGLGEDLYKLYEENQINVICGEAKTIYE